MSTKLEAMVGYLAGRKAEPGLLEELADPTSEASRFLEATRVRSRALLAEPPAVEPPRSPRSNRWGLISLAMLAIAALVAFAATLQVVDRRFRLLEASLQARDLEARADARRWQATLERLTEPRPKLEWPRELESSLKRIEAELTKINDRDQAADSDRSTEMALAELAAIRHEIATNERASAARVEELQAAIHDSARVLRLLLKAAEPLAPVNPQAPVFNPPRAPSGGEPRRPKP